jgi:hypothetical protein
MLTRVGFGVITSAFLLTPTALAQTPAQQPAAATYTAPRTTFGQPSLEGVWTQNFMMVMESTPGTPTLTVSESEAKSVLDVFVKRMSAMADSILDPEVLELAHSTDGLPIVRGERRTRNVVLPVDGKLPYTPDARKRPASSSPVSTLDNHEERPNWERCITSLGLPPVTGIGTTSVNPRHIIQTPNQILLHTEYGDEARIIPLRATHLPPELHSALGDSIGRWEGETLVIETIGLPERDRVRAFSNLIVTGDSKVIERFTRVSENELLYQYTVEDPNIYSAPWLAEYSLYKTDQRMFEHACHEGNYSLPHILQAKRVADNKPAAKANP